MIDKLLTRLIIFLLRRKLGVKICQDFYFTNQKAKDDRYYFTKGSLMKYSAAQNRVYSSSVSLNHLLSDDCTIEIENSGEWLNKMFTKGES